MKSLLEFTKIYNEIDEKDQALRSASRTRFPHGHEEKPEYYPYIPFHGIKDMYHAFCRAEKFMKDSSKYGLGGMDVFMDAGCGTGRVLALAKAFGFKKVMGIEYGEMYIEPGREVFGLSDTELIHMDAFDITWEFMRKIRIVYTYMPIAKHSLMTQLHCHLVDKAQYNTVFMEMLPSYYPMNMVRDLTRKDDKDGGYAWMEKR